MRELGRDDDAEDRWDMCDLCGDSLEKYESPRYLELEKSSCLERVDAGFCSWEHLAAWIDRGEPSYEIWPAYVSPSGWSRIKDRVVDAGALILIIFWSGLATYGLHTLASRMV